MVMAMVMDMAEIRMQMAALKKSLAAFGMRRLTLALFLLVSGVILSWLSVTSTVAAIADDLNPDLALWVQPDNSIALAAKADQIWTAHPEKAGGTQTTQLAERALQTQSLNANAIRLLALSAQSQGKMARANQLIALATKVTRRDSLTQLWLVQQALDQNNAPKAMKHFDVVLRTNAKAQTYLFPQLAELLEYEDFQIAFKPYLSVDRPWLGPFLSYVIWNTEETPLLAMAIGRTKGMPASDQQYRSYETQIIGRLVGKQYYEDARQFYMTLKGADENSFASIGLNPRSTDAKFAPFNWRLDSDAGIGAYVRTNRKYTELFASASDVASGVVAQKLLYLLPGNYIFKQQSDIAVQGAGASASWVIRCMTEGDSRIAWTYPLTKAVNGKLVSVPVQIPNGCNYQFIELAVVGGTDPDGIELTVSRLSLNDAL
jgi:hypothetical protein